VNYPEVAIRRWLFYTVACAVLIGVTQVGILIRPIYADSRPFGSLFLTLASLLILLLATAVLVLRARRLTHAQAKIWLTPGLDRLVFNHAPVGMLLSAADGRVEAVNAAYSHLTGFAEDQLLGNPDSFQQAGSLSGSLAEEMNAALFSAGLWTGEVWVRKPSGEALAFNVSRIALADGEQSVQGVLTLCQEASSGTEAERLMLWQAHHDTLTKLPNGNLFQDRLSRFLLEHGDTAGAVLSINLDGFSHVNDSMSFAAGDQVLMEASHRIALAVRETDTVARMGGDQFAVLLAGLENDDELNHIATGVVESMAAAFYVRGREFHVTASVGVNSLQMQSPSSPLSPGEVIQRADSARVQASLSGGNRFMFYEPAMNQRAQARYKLETALRRALADKALELFYQPLVDQYESQIVSFEALLRWQHPELGSISPAEFIPLAEDTGLIVDIGLWVLQEAQEQLRRWSEADFSHLRLSINISTRQLRDVADVERLIDRLDAPETSRLTLEITESLLIADKALYRDFLQRAKSLGARIALDDFGTGFSSLSYLRDYDFDILKIDRSFVQGLKPASFGDQADRNLVASIISLGQILDLEVVAEGVEEEQELQALRELGCALIQGYYYGTPMPASAATLYFKEHQVSGEFRSP